jgi:xanthine dehydrogenase accessory factor
MDRAEHDRIPETALAWINEGKKAALATVVQTWGSAPRPQGSQLVISSDAEIQGSVSGGCVESAVVAEALEALENGNSRVLEYGVSDDDAFAVGLACGGTIRIMVEPIGVGNGPSQEMIEELVEARAARKPMVYAVNPTTWERRFLTHDDPLSDAAETARISDKSGFEADWFLGVHNPPLRMIVVGAVHNAQPLLVMAREAGYDPFLIDPREAFGAVHRFPGETISNDWPDDAIQAYGIDARTALVTLSHDPKIDDPALLEGLKSEAFYIGALGSKRTHAKRVTRLEAEGLTGAELAKVHSPIGADIGSKSPAEIAISIMAEITERLRRPETRR